MLKEQRGEITITGLIFAAIVIFGLWWGYNYFKMSQEVDELNQRLAVASKAENWEEVLKLTNLLTQVSSDFISNSERSYIYLERGRAFHHKNNLKEAVACYKSSIEYKPVAASYCNLGLIYEHWRDVENATKMYKKYLELLGNEGDGKFSKHAKSYLQLNE